MYDIFWDNMCVGKASVRKEGSFYRFYCFCDLPGTGIYRIYVTDGDVVFDLGICVPDGDRYICIARVACKRFSCAALEFSLVDCDERKRIRITTGMEFAYLEKLNTAHLYIADGQPEIIIDPNPDPQDNDQSLTHLHKWVQI